MQTQTNPLSFPNADASRAKYEINPKYLPCLARIPMYESVLICDDSGSMREVADKDTMSPVTRWEELKQIVQIVVEAHVAFKTKCHLYFINRGYARDVSSWDQVKGLFVELPGGGTNLLPVLELVKQHNVGPDFNPPVLHIFTDGHPTDYHGNENITAVQNWFSVEQFNKRAFYSIVLCTDDEIVERDYRKLERYVRKNEKIGIDVTMDYRGEMLDVQETRGKSFRFTFGDYVAKVLCGAIDPTVHNIDLPQCSCIIM